jgi:hypothetical protein
MVLIASVLYKVNKFLSTIVSINRRLARYLGWIGQPNKSA